MKKKYRIILEQTGEKTIEAEYGVDAEEQFISNVTGDELLQMLIVSAEEI